MMDGVQLMAFASQDFRRTLGKFATGITVVTTLDGAGQPHGITVNSFTSVSLDPPLVLICIDKKTETHRILPQSGFFCANLLTDAQQDLSDRFAGRMPGLQDVFNDLAAHTEATGAPVLGDTLGFVDCRIVNAVDAGDHTVFIGQVEALGYNNEAEPLLYFSSKYRGLNP